MKQQHGNEGEVLFVIIISQVIATYLCLYLTNELISKTVCCRWFAISPNCLLTLESVTIVKFLEAIKCTKHQCLPRKFRIKLIVWINIKAITFSLGSYYMLDSVSLFINSFYSVVWLNWDCKYFILENKLHIKNT